jgi:nicotinamidase/pyrazinamidase
MSTGTNINTEMYSAIAAEVPVSSDASTKLNRKLLKQLNDCDKLIVSGQALSHCVNFTVRHIVEHWEGNRSNIIILKDCECPQKVMGCK